MSRKSRVTQELRNGFPDWTRVRTDDQSVGAGLLNAIGLQLEVLNTELFRNFSNFMLTTAYVGELDQMYKFILPNGFEFTLANENSLSPEQLAPTVSGLTSSGWVELQPVLSGSIQEFWYQALPSRIEEVEEFPVSGLLVASGLSTDVSLQLVNSGLFLDNRLTVVADGDVLVGLDSSRQILRSKVRINGATWKGSSESEDVVFLFSESKLTNKAWDSVDRIQCVDFPSEALVHVYSHRFNRPYYVDSFETMSQLEDSRENLPLFWNLTDSNTGFSSLQLSRYSVNKATDLLAVKPSIIEYKTWDLLDTEGGEVTAIDIIPVPFQQMMYVLTENKLLVFDTYQELPNVSSLTENMQNTLIKLEISNDYPVRGEEIEVLALFSRPVKTIVKHRVKIKYPDGAEFGILEDGTLVPTTGDFYVYRETSDRFIRPSMFLELDDYGQHDITLECVYLDGTTEIVQRAILVQAKVALAELDLTYIANPAVGIDIDHQNRLLILDSNNIVHRVKLHYDLMLIDFERKELLFREKYNEIKVIKS